MPQLSLTDFVDFAASTTPVARFNKLAEIKRRPVYHPSQDFWRPLRSSIQEIHQENAGKAALEAILSQVSEHKIDNYREAIEGYQRWWGRKHFSWFQPPSGVFSGEGVDIRVNPELGLEYNNQRHIIKLYFKSEALSQRKVDIILLVMAISLSMQYDNSNTCLGVLDVKRHHLYGISSCNYANLEIALRAELSYIASCWEHII